MFAYLRYFSVVSFILVLIIAISLGKYFFHQAASKVILYPTEKSSVSLASAFIKNIWYPNRPGIKSFLDKSPEEWEKDSYFKEFYKRTLRHFQALPLVKVNMYTAKNNRFFTSNDNNIIFLENNDKTNLDFAEAQNGIVKSTIIDNAAFYADNKSLQKGTLVRTLVPVLDGQTKQLEVLLELYHDTSDTWKQIYYFQIAITGGITLLCTFFYLALFITSHKATLIINRQHEANLELARAKMQAEAESQEKSKFLANISHELRTPLNAIIGFSDVIKNEVMGPVNNDQYKEYIRDINTSGIHLLSLINDILDYSKAQANKLEVEKVDIDVAKLIKTCLRLVLPRAQEAKVELIEKAPVDYIILKADPKRLKQVLLNLLSNAVKFTPEGGKVTLAGHPDDTGEKLVLEVMDTGIGIAPKDISKAMATFGQVDNKLSRRYEGTGLGLPLTKKLVELMGGTFELKSEVGFGTTVTISFALEKKEKPAEAAPQNIINTSTPNTPSPAAPAKKQPILSVPSPAKLAASSAPATAEPKEERVGKVVTAPEPQDFPSRRNALQKTPRVGPVSLSSLSGDQAPPAAAPAPLQEPKKEDPET